MRAVSRLHHSYETSCGLRKPALGKVPPERFNIEWFYYPGGSRARAMSVGGGYVLKGDIRLFEIPSTALTILRQPIEATDDSTGTAVVHGPLTAKGLGACLRTPRECWFSLEDVASSSFMRRIGPHQIRLRPTRPEHDAGPGLRFIYLHQAYKAIRDGDCSGAMVTGANLIMT
ncbi:hypothetical protein BJ170DRAFT_737130 [Xylariales sp. AK1849]|nr:hypothetical protein BJ170DRAFT_737130 [Xylariales sp. AK1849]